MANERYKYGKGEDAAEATILTDKSGENRAVAIWNLHVLIVPEGSGYFAQAFEIDYGVQGQTVEEVKKRFEEGLAATIHHNIDIYGSIRNVLHPNEDWYALKEEVEGSEYDYSCVEWRHVAPRNADLFNFIQYEAVRAVAA